MQYLAIVAWTITNRLAKYQDYANEPEAIAHVARVVEKFPGAFVVENPGGSPTDWLIDPVAKTVSILPLPSALIERKAIKQRDFIAEAVMRIAAQVPDWDNLDTIKTVAGLWDSHLSTNATAAQTVARDIYLYVRDTVPTKFGAILSRTALDIIDATAADPFGDGTPWPR